MIIGTLQGYTETYTNSTKLDEPIHIEKDTRVVVVEKPKVEALPPPTNIRHGGTTWSKLQYTSHIRNFKERGFVIGAPVYVKLFGDSEHKQLGSITAIREHISGDEHTFWNSKYPRCISVRLPMGSIMNYSINDLELVKC